jgi:hypothetical protein
MFVHDFVHVDRTHALAVEAFATAVVPRLGELVLQAWSADLEGWSSAGIDRRDVVPDRPAAATVGATRRRDESVIVPVHWPWTSARWFPELDADLEIAPLGLTHTDLQLQGWLRFPPSVPRWSAEERVADRLTAAALRRLLLLVATELTLGELVRPMS